MLFIGLWIAYAVTCLTRNTYSAAISAIVNEGLFTKSATGTISAAFYLVYGAAQFAGGYLSDRISPAAIIMSGLAGSLVSNAVMASTENFTVMLIAWSFNGLCQFGVWPATLKIVTGVLMPEHRRKASMYISMCMCAGTVFSYFAAMILLKYFRWPSLFWLSDIIIVIVIVMWAVISSKAKPHLVTDLPAEEEVLVQKSSDASDSNKTVPLTKLLALSGFFILIIPMTFRCMLDNGIKSWVPTMMMESYGITPDISSMIATIVVLINISGIYIARWFYPRYCKNVTVAVSLMFAVSLPIFFFLLYIGKIPIIISILLLVVSTTTMYSINQLMGIDIPAAFGKYNRTGTIAGIANAFGSFGITLSNFAYGFIAEHWGWTAVIVTWIVLAASSMICCLIAAPFWKRFTSGK